jgi:nitroreductase
MASSRLVNAGTSVDGRTADKGLAVEPDTGPSPAHALDGSADSEVLERLLMTRHSCRAFLPDPVPQPLIRHILTLAQRTPSWCNSQPWELTIASGAAIQRLRTALLAHAESIAGGGPEAGEPDFPFPTAYENQYLARRRESGFQLYDAVGVARGDKAAYRRQSLRNFDFFNAPHVAIITTPKALGVYGAIDCGGYVSAFALAACANGVASIPQAAVAAFPDVLREQLGLAPERNVVCAISFGFEDDSHVANSYRTRRALLEDTVRFIAD